MERTRLRPVIASWTLLCVSVQYGCGEAPAQLDRADFLSPSKLAKHFETDESQELCQAVSIGNVTEIERLASQGAEVPVTGTNGMTLLHVAFLTRDPEVVAKLLQLGANPNTQYTGTESFGVNAKLGKSFVYLALNSNDSMFDVVAKHGFDAKARMLSGDTLLHAAADSSVDDAKNRIATLIQRGADPDAYGQFGQTPAMRAVSRRADYSVARHLLELGADASKYNRAGSMKLIDYCINSREQKQAENAAARDSLDAEYAQLIAALDARNESIADALQVRQDVQSAVKRLDHAEYAIWWKAYREELEARRNGALMPSEK